MMNRTMLLGFLILGTLSSQASVVPYEAECRVELRDLQGRLQDLTYETVLLDQASTNGGRTTYYGTLESPVENLPFFVKLELTSTTFTTDIQYRRLSGRIPAYLQQANQGIRSTQGYRAPGNLTYGQSRTQFFKRSNLDGFKFFQENTLHDGVIQEDGGPTCYPVCPPRGPYDGPDTISLPVVGKVNVFCAISIR